MKPFENGATDGEPLSRTNINVLLPTLTHIDGKYTILRQIVIKSLSKVQAVDNEQAIRFHVKQRYD